MAADAKTPSEQTPAKGFSETCGDEADEIAVAPISSVVPKSDDSVGHSIVSVEWMATRKPLKEHNILLAADFPRIHPVFRDAFPIDSPRSVKAVQHFLVLLARDGCALTEASLTSNTRLERIIAAAEKAAEFYPRPC